MPPCSMPVQCTVSAATALGPAGRAPCRFLVAAKLVRPCTPEHCPSGNALQLGKAIPHRRCLAC